MKISPEEIEKETSEFLERGPSFDPEVVSHILLLFRKMKLKLKTEVHFGTTYWSVHDSSERMLTLGRFHAESLDERERPVPYERIYGEHLSSRFYYIALPVNANEYKWEFFNFPKLNPTGKFCIEVDLMPFN